MAATGRHRRAALLLLVGCVSVACSSAPAQPLPAPSSLAPSSSLPAPQSLPASTPAPITGADWPTYHHDNARTGVAGDLAPVGRLALGWHTGLDGAVYGQPLVVGDRLLAATENDTVYALDVASGRVLWSAHVATPAPKSQLPCGDIDPLGITGTMVYDPATHLVFAAAETAGAGHLLVGIDVATGAVIRRTGVPPPTGDPVAHQQRGALTLLGGRVYVPYGGLDGDCGQYVGSVVAVSTTGAPATLSYAIPTRREAGIWATGGAVVRGGTLLYAVGNGASTSAYDGSDSVVALSATLRLTDRFAPSSWANDNLRDLDLGSMTPALVSGYVYAQGKAATGYVLRGGRLGGIGGQIAQLDVCAAFGGSAVSGDTVYVPCQDGLRAVRVDAAGRPSLRWSAVVTAAGSPVVGGGAVWVVDYDRGTLYALDPASGAVRQQVGIGIAPHFTSPTPAGTRVYVGTMFGVVAVDGA